jgi:glycine/D-amino acid oxidase-like deaminating enzyme
LVYATGYETQQLFAHDDVLRLKSTYALVTEPILNLPDGLKRALVWDTADPYFYARTAKDNRMMLGGEDEWIVDAAQRDELIPQKRKKLLAKFNELFPDLHAEEHLTWAGTFAETKDGLPYIGEHERYPHSYFALGFGGNGITFSITAASIIRSLFQTGQSEPAGVFRFGR